MLFFVFRNTSTVVVLIYEIVCVNSPIMKADLLEIFCKDSLQLQFTLPGKQNFEKDIWTQEI
jgi:hypothetical protein